MQVSVVIAAKNEAESIAECIGSVSFAQEVLVIDDQSTDKTSEIASGLGARVMKRKMDGFATQKNFGIDNSHNDWVLILDADERVSPELANEIRDLVPEKDVHGYSFPFKNYIGAKWLKHGGLYPDPHIRLFDKRFVRYGKREIHEMLEIDPAKVRELKGDVIHHTYKNYSEYLSKVRKYAPLEASWSQGIPSVKDAVKTFLNRYIRLRGFKDGIAGFLSALFLAYYQLLKRKAMLK